jgi:hypothetical protein
MLSEAFETNCKSLRSELGPIEELPMLKLVHSIEAVGGPNNLDLSGLRLGTDARWRRVASRGVSATE